MKNEDICRYKFSVNQGSGTCGETRLDLNHDLSAHTRCTGVDAAFCTLHEFVPGVAQYIVDAQKVRLAAEDMADLAPAAAEALRLRSQDIFEAGEKAARNELPAGIYAVSTENSVYLVRYEENGQQRVLSRTSLRDDGWLPTNLAYSGWVLGQAPQVGERFSFEWSQQPSKGPINVSPVTSITPLGA